MVTIGIRQAVIQKKHAVGRSGRKTKVTTSPWALE
jgi:hypothetical protein